MHAPPERTAMWFWFMTVVGTALIVASVAALGTALGERSVARRWHSLSTIVVFLAEAIPLGLFVSMVSFFIPQAVEWGVFHTTEPASRAAERSC